MNSWEHFLVCQRLSRAGVPINGQQIMLPFPLLWGGLWWERSWQEATVKKDNSASRVLHFLSGKRGAGLSGGDRLSALSLSTTLAGSAEGWGGVSGLMVWTKGPVHTRMLSVISEDGGRPLGAQLGPLGSFLSEASCPLSEGALGEGGHL